MSIYNLIKPLLFRVDAETAHDRMLRQLIRRQWSAPGRALLTALAGAPEPQRATAMGIEFAHPVGLAAGFDKNAEAVIAMQCLGFSFVEIGTVTPRPQPGNPKPRLWRFPEARALVNALGFPGQGMRTAAANLQRARESGLVKIPIGINIGKNADTSLERAVDDYLAALDCLYPLGDFFVVNVSSPNTTGLRDLQAVTALRPLLGAVMERTGRLGGKPLLVKIAPDLDDQDVVEIARLTRELGMAGLIAGNTTIRREAVPRAAALERGGLSGEPLFPRTRELIKLLHSELAPTQTLIAAGGISTASDVRELIRGGANLIQVYTALIYAGPRCVTGLCDRQFRGISTI